MNEQKNNNSYVLIRYESWYSSDKKKKINLECFPIMSDLFNFRCLTNINICKTTYRIYDHDVKKISDILRFSNGPFYFEKATHLYVK